MLRTQWQRLQGLAESLESRRTSDVGWGGHETLWTAGPEARERLGGRTLRRGARRLNSQAALLRKVAVT